MSGILHDLKCDACDYREWTVVRGPEDYICECGAELKIRLDRWDTVHTDLFGTPQYSDATGERHSSQRQKEAAMRELGFRPKGDKVHGARVDLSMKNSTCSYAGQGSRKSTAERGA